MFAHSSATTVAASISAAPPVSVLRKSLTGAARFRPQAVRSENGSERRWAFTARPSCGGRAPLPSVASCERFLAGRLDRHGPAGPAGPAKPSRDSVGRLGRRPRETADRLRQRGRSGRRRSSFTGCGCWPTAGSRGSSCSSSRGMRRWPWSGPMTRRRSSRPGPSRTCSPARPWARSPTTSPR